MSAMEIYRATIVPVSMETKTTKTNKKYYEVKDQQGITYSCWDFALCGSMRQGTPVEVAVKRDGRFLNLVHVGEFFKAQQAAAQAGQALPPAPAAAPAPDATAGFVAAPPNATATGQPLGPALGAPLVQLVGQTSEDAAAERRAKNREIRRLSLIKSAVELVVGTPIEGQVGTVDAVIKAAELLEAWVISDDVPF